MARKPKQQPEETLWTRAKWQGFVNVRLTTEEKKAIKEKLLSEANGYEFLMNAATAGYKCSISYSVPEEVFTASLTGTYQQKPNAGITMSMRHRDLIVALTALEWCHDQAGFSQEWSERWTLAEPDDW
jgi:hypothetical protein